MKERYLDRNTYTYTEKYKDMCILYRYKAIETIDI